MLSPGVCGTQHTTEKSTGFPKDQVSISSRAGMWAIYTIFSLNLHDL